jgi:lysozyme
LNQKGIDLIKKWEGLRLEAYKDPAGIWTIGYGITNNVFPGLKITEDEAEKKLDDKIAKIEDFLDRAVKTELTDNQWSALVCLIYNIGMLAFTNSTLLKLLNIKRYIAAGEEFLRWIKINGVPSQGLLNRRLEEKKLFMENFKDDNGTDKGVNS